MLQKVAVVGAGNVGATAAQRLAEKNLARTVVLIDVLEGIPQGKALDQFQSGPIEGFDTRVIGTNGYDEAAGAEVFVVTAGIARKPGMSRDDLVKTNAGIVRSVAEQIRRVAPAAIIVVVSNPLDVMCHVAMQASGFPRERVLGMAGVLDTARYRTFLAEAMDVSVEDIQAMVLGGHGDTMVPLVSYTTVSGIPVTQLLEQAKLDAIVDRARNGGAGCVVRRPRLEEPDDLGAAVQMVEAIALDKKRILPCAVWLQGEYGIRDVFCGVPVKLGRNGLEQIVDIRLTADESKALHASAEAVRSTMVALG
jgi:malate dehydrogenase